MPILDAETSEHPADLLRDLVHRDPARRWWAMYTKPRQEKALARHLVQLNVPFYLPLVPRDHRLRGRIVRSHIPLFGGYFFVFGNEAERVLSLTTNRIAHILPVADQPQLTVDLAQIARLIELQTPLTLEKKLTSGDAVRVTSGPMEGMEGIVLSRRGKAQLIVGVQLLHQGVSLEIDDFVLERI